MEMNTIRKQYEQETDKEAMVFSPKGVNPSNGYAVWLEEKVEEMSEKATAYDRLTNGGKKTLFMEDYHGELHQINPCPVCGKAPERNNCGPELQGVSCFDCDVHSTFCKEIGSNNMLLKAIEKWNDGKFDVPTNS